MKAALRLAVAAVLLALVWHAIDGDAALGLLQHAEPGLLLLALGLLSATIALSALRWAMTALALGQALRWQTALAEYHLGMLLNMTLPGGVVGDAGRAVRTRADAGIALAATSVLVERLSGQAALLVLLGGGLLLWPPVAAWGPAPRRHWRWQRGRRPCAAWAGRCAGSGARGRGCWRRSG